MADTRGMTELRVLVGRWVAAGIISEAQGQRILADDDSRPVLVAAPRGSLVAEALSYVGGMLVLLAVGIIATIYWPSLGAAARGGLAGTATAAVLAAGFLLPRGMGAVGVRLRSVLWAVAVASFGLFIGIILDGLGWGSRDTVLTAALCALALAIVLWRLQQTFLQQLALGAAVVVTVGAATAHLPHADQATAGLALWGAALAWLALNWGELLPPQRTGYLLGGGAAVAGSLLTTQENWGLALAGITVVALVAAAVLVRDLWLLGVGAVGVLVYAPIIVNRFFEGELAAPLALLGAGVLLIALGVLTARRRSEAHSGTAHGRSGEAPSTEEGSGGAESSGNPSDAAPSTEEDRPWATIQPWPAATLAAVVIAVVAPVVVAIGS